MDLKDITLINQQMYLCIGGTYINESLQQLCLAESFLQPCNIRLCVVFENWWKVQFWRLVRLIRCSNLDVMVGPPKSSPVADCWAQIWPVTQSLGWPAQPWRPGQRTPRQRSARERWGRSWWGGGQNLAHTLPRTSYQLSGTPKIRVIVRQLNKERK